MSKTLMKIDPVPEPSPRQKEKEQNYKDDADDAKSSPTIISTAIPIITAAADPKEQYQQDNE
jgi:hypothetical protein